MATSKTYQGATRDEALERAGADLRRPVDTLEVLEVVSRVTSAGAAGYVEVRIRLPSSAGSDAEAVVLKEVLEAEPGSGDGSLPLESKGRADSPDGVTAQPQIAGDGDRAAPERLAPRAETFLVALLSQMGVDARLETELDDENVYIEIMAEGGVGGLLIGRQGQTLDAIQYLVNRVVLPGAAARGRVYLDTEGYRARYRRKLEELAHRYRDEALRAGKPVTLEEFSSRDRWIIHQALLDDPRVTTRSVGDEHDRKLMIIPRR